MHRSVRRAPSSPPRTTLVLASCLAVCLAVPLGTPVQISAQQQAPPVAERLSRALVGAGMGGAFALMLTGPAGPSALASDGALIGGLVGAGVAASLIPFPEGTRFSATLGVSFFGMGDLGDQYEFLKEEEAQVQAVEEPGLGAEWNFHADIPWRERLWLTAHAGVMNDAASVNAEEIVCSGPTDCSRADRLVAESTAQSLFLAAGARWKPWPRPPVFFRGSAGLGYIGFTTPLVGGLAVLEGLPETQTTVAPYGEVAIELGGVVEGKGPDIQLGVRLHPTPEVDYRPVGRIAEGEGGLDFSGIFMRLGWTF